MRVRIEPPSTGAKVVEIIGGSVTRFLRAREQSFRMSAFGRLVARDKTQYERGLDGALRRVPPKVRGKAAVKGAKRRRQAIRHYTEAR